MSRLLRLKCSRASVGQMDNRIERRAARLTMTLQNSVNHRMLHGFDNLYPNLLFAARAVSELCQ